MNWLVELTKGGTATLAAIVVVEAGVIVFLFNLLIKAYREDGKEVAEALTKVNATQIQHTFAMNNLLEIMKSIQSVFMSGGTK